MIVDDRTDGRPLLSFRLRGSENWRSLLRTGANLLVVGPRCALEAFVAAAASEMSEPVWLVGPTQQIPHEQAGTFVLYDASRLDVAQQQALLALLSTAETARPQIISLSEKHLWVEHGSSPIREDLYYRLNTICLDVEPGADQAGRELLMRAFDTAQRAVRAAG
jgi:hypothetical protein